LAVPASIARLFRRNDERLGIAVPTIHRIA
jgi:hypothetical protein